MRMLALSLLSSSLAFAAPQGEISSVPEVEMEVLSWAPRVFLLHDFLSPKECDEMIALGKPHLKRSKIVADDSSNTQQELQDERRTSYGMFFDRYSKQPLLCALEERLSRLTHLSQEYGEGIQLLYYGVGAEFVPHHDFFDRDTQGGRAHLRDGGQRLVTVIMYLNTPEKGGETLFPILDLAVQPKKGTALVFYNCTPDGNVDEMTLHAGAPVFAGEKWIATKWMRAEKQED